MSSLRAVRGYTKNIPALFGTINFGVAVLNYGEGI
jgi:hypothetical protein